MKAITTRYRGPTDTRGARITASDQDGNRVSISYPHDKREGQEAHFAAARELCDRMQWHGKLAGGATRDGYVWVWVDQWSTYEIGYIDQQNRRQEAKKK